MDFSHNHNEIQEIEDEYIVNYTNKYNDYQNKSPFSHLADEEEKGSILDFFYNCNTYNDIQEIYQETNTIKYNTNNITTNKVYAKSRKTSNTSNMKNFSDLYSTTVEKSKSNSNSLSNNTINNLPNISPNTLIINTNNTSISNIFLDKTILSPDKISKNIERQKTFHNQLNLIKNSNISNNTNNNTQNTNINNTTTRNSLLKYKRKNANDIFQHKNMNCTNINTNTNTYTNTNTNINIINSDKPNSNDTNIKTNTTNNTNTNTPSLRTLKNRMSAKASNQKKQDFLKENDELKAHLFLMYDKLDFLCSECKEHFNSNSNHCSSGNGSSLSSFRISQLRSSFPKLLTVIGVLTTVIVLICVFGYGYEGKINISNGLIVKYSNPSTSTNMNSNSNDKVADNSSISNRSNSNPSFNSFVNNKRNLLESTRTEITTTTDINTNTNININTSSLITDSKNNLHNFLILPNQSKEDNNNNTETSENPEVNNIPLNQASVVKPIKNIQDNNIKEEETIPFKSNCNTSHPIELKSILMNFIDFINTNNNNKSNTYYIPYKCPNITPKDNQSYTVSIEKFLESNSNYSNFCKKEEEPVLFDSNNTNKTVQSPNASNNIKNNNHTSNSSNFNFSKSIILNSILNQSNLKKDEFILQMTICPSDYSNILKIEKSFINNNLSSGSNSSNGNGSSNGKSNNSSTDININSKDVGEKKYYDFNCKVSGIQEIILNKE